jgi:hypothetical protein
MHVMAEPHTLKASAFNTSQVLYLLHELCSAFNPQDASSLSCVLQRSDLSEEQRKVLGVLERTFKCYITEDATASSLKEKLNEAEAKLAAARNTMQLGHTDPETGEAAC